MPNQGKKTKEKRTNLNETDKNIDVEQQKLAEEESNLSFIEEANIAAKTIITSWIEKVFYETACSLLRTCVYQKHTEELLHCQNIDVDDNDDQRQMKTGKKMIKLNVTDEDIKNVYDGCHRLGNKWKQLLQECEQWDAASSIENILENGNFLELGSMDNNLDSKDSNASGASHDLPSNSASKISSKSSHGLSTITTRNNSSRKRNLTTTQDISKVRALSQVKYHDPCNLLFHKKSKTSLIKTSKSSKNAMSSSSSWVPLPAMNTTIPPATTDKNKSKKRRNYIPRATVLPPSKIKKLYNGELYSRPSPTLTMFTDPNLGQSENENLSLEDRRKLWAKVQVSHIDQIAAICNSNQTSRKKDDNPKLPFNTNEYEFNWFYGWDIIQQAVGEMPRKKRSQLQQVEIRKTYEVIPKSLIREETKLASNNTDNGGNKKDNAQNVTITNESNPVNQKETDLVIAKSRALYLELAERRRRQELQQQQIQLEFEQSGETNESGWEDEAPESHNNIKGREPSTIREEMYDINDIRSELVLATDEMSAEKIENDMIHKLSEDESDEDEYAHVIQGSLKEVGAIHMWEQSSTDINIDRTSLVEAKTIEELRKKYRKERLHMFANETTGITPNSAPNNAKKYKTKICRCTGIDGKEYMNLDLGECMVECIDNNGTKRLLAFRSLEVCLIEYDPK